MGYDKAKSGKMAKGGKCVVVKQMIVLVVLSILLGTLVARGIAEVANGYFHATMDSLVGSYGEYDFIVQVQEEKRALAEERLVKLLDEQFASGTYQEAPALGGRANFFVAIPSVYKTKTIFERIDSYFAVLPGAAGLSIISEPRLSIRGVPTGTVASLIQELERMDGVAFAFRDGSTIQVMLTDMVQSQQVQEAVELWLNAYRVLEVRFPTGAEPVSPVQLGEELARKLMNSGAETVKYVSVDEKRDDETALLATMLKMREFLTLYRSCVTVTLDEAMRVEQGESVRIEGESELLVRLEQVADRQANGVIVSGDASDTEQDLIVYRQSQDGSRERLGTARIDNPRVRMLRAAEELLHIARVLPQGSGEAQEMFDRLRSVLAECERILPDIAQMAEQIGEIKRRMTDSGIMAVRTDTSRLQEDLSKAIASLDNTRRWLNLAAWASPDIREAKQSLTEVTERMVMIEQYLNEAQTQAGDIERLQDFVEVAGEGATQLAETLEGLERMKTVQALDMAEPGIDALADSELVVMLGELQAVMQTLPLMRDEEINESIRLIDRLAEGYLIPNKKIQLMTTQGLRTEEAIRIIYETVGHDRISVSEGALGMIEPNTYLEVYRMLHEVKRILAGLTALMMTAFFLAFDHTSLISMMKLRGARSSAWRVAAYGYGATVGALMLAVIFYLAGGGIPYVPFGIIVIVGAVGGLVIAVYSERLGPVSEGEIIAGESLGLSDSEIMREIVIPSGRPGLSLLLNRFGLRFK